MRLLYSAKLALYREIPLNRGGITERADCAIENSNGFYTGNLAITFS